MFLYLLATGLDGPGIECRWRRNFPHLSRPALGSTQPPVQWVPRLPGVQSGRDVTLTPHPLLVPCPRKSRAISLLPLWAVRPVQSLSACTRVHFAFTFTTYFHPLYIPLFRKTSTNISVRFLVFLTLIEGQKLFWPHKVYHVLLDLTSCKVRVSLSSSRC
jgi:hypothetical protein